MTTSPPSSRRWKRAAGSTRTSESSLPSCSPRTRGRSSSCSSRQSRSPTLALGVDPYPTDIMDRPPRNPKEGVLSRDILFLIVVVSGILTAGTLGVFFLELREGADPTRAQTVAFTTIVFFELFLVFAMRSPRQTIWEIGLFTNTKLILAVLGSMLLQAAVIYIPFLHGVFGTEPLTVLDWVETLLISFSAFAFVDVLKVVRRRMRS